MTETNSTNNSYEDNTEQQYIDELDSLNNIKRISVPVDKLKEFIALLYGTNEIIITKNVVSNNYLDLTSRNVIVL
jgi:hypothetical protein